MSSSIELSGNRWDDLYWNPDHPDADRWHAEIADEMAAGFPDQASEFNRLTVTLCGSLSRAAYDLRRTERALALAGHIVHAPCPPLADEPAPTPGQISLLTARHYEAIRRSDLVIAVIPDGRPGDATHQEMRYAMGAGKQARWLSDVDALVGDVAAWLDGAEVPA